MREGTDEKVWEGSEGMGGESERMIRKVEV